MTTINMKRQVLRTEVFPVEIHIWESKMILANTNCDICLNPLKAGEYGVVALDTEELIAYTCHMTCFTDQLKGE